MTTQSPYIFDVDEDNFKEKVLDASHEMPVLVDFSADWCGPCLALAPVLERVAPEYEGRLRCYQVDADENMKLCGRYGLRGFPTVLLFVNGEEVDRFTSARTASFVREFLDRHLDPAFPHAPTPAAG